MSKIKLPVVIIGLKSNDSINTKVKVMAPTDALLFLNDTNTNQDDIVWVFDGEFDCNMQKIVDCIIEYPSFFKCLDVAIDSEPLDRSMKQLLSSAKHLPEN